MRFNELIAGVRSDLAVKVFGDDMEALHETGGKISKILEKIQGASDVKVEQVTGLPVLTIQMNREEMARYGLNVSDVQDVIEIAMGGKSAGKVFEGDRRFELLVRLPENMRSNIEALKRLPIPLPNVGADSNTGLLPAAYLGERKRPGYITLGSIAEFNIKPGPIKLVGKTANAGLL